MGTLVSGIVGVVVTLAVVGGIFTGLNVLLNRGSQRWEDRLRPWIFVGPALLFLGIALVIPAIRTILLSLQGGSRGQDGFTFENWTRALQDRAILEVSWELVGNVLTSRLFIIAVVLAVVAGVLAWRAARTAPVPSAEGPETSGGPRLDLGSPGPSILLIAAAAIVLMAMLSTFRGAIINNLWWVVVVAGFSTILGLAFAVLADRSRGENVAKSLIFMPMAISLVGAAVIWKYIYDTPGAGQAEGLLNVVWPGGPIDFIRGSAPGGGTIRPWNNVFIMAIMIWIQTGFAMVVLSAAVKGVPAELHEAARVDGANEAQVFWRVTLPQITSTIVVVVTTLTITVLKIFDLVKATTNGQGGTDVLANLMYEGLRVGQFAQASTFATMILVLVLPVMYLNVRRTSREIRV
jgi:ABC-type sugar transport system permease subunit